MPIAGSCLSNPAGTLVGWSFLLASLAFCCLKLAGVSDLSEYILPAEKVVPLTSLGDELGRGFLSPSLVSPGGNKKVVGLSIVGIGRSGSAMWE